MSRDDEAIQARPATAVRFEEHFRRCLAREPLGPVEERDLSKLFEFVARRLLPGCYDGVVNLTATVRKARQVVFRADMWVLGNAGGRVEPFQAMVTDKRITKQGLWIVVSVGRDRAEAEAATVFDIARSAESGRREG